MKTLLSFLSLIVLLLLSPAFESQVTHSAMPTAEGIQFAFDSSGPTFAGTALEGRLSNFPSADVDVQIHITRNDETVLFLEYAPRTHFSWVPMDEGRYDITVTARGADGARLQRISEPLEVLPHSGRAPVVFSTNHPLVAFYSADACPVGQSMRVLFKRPKQATFMSTDLRPCDGTTRMNFLIAGMRPISEYNLRYQLVDANGNTVGVGPLSTFTTGLINPLLFSATTVDLLLPEAYLGWQALLHGSVLGPAQHRIWASDIYSVPIWYYDAPSPDWSPWFFRPVHGGGLLMVSTDSNSGMRDQLLQQIDLLGNVVRETSATELSIQLTAMGQLAPMTSIHHDATPLPGGHTAIIGSLEQPNDGQQPGEDLILGDYVVVLDENWQVAWAWNSFDHLDVTREAVLGETCSGGTSPGCPPLPDGVSANDWTHSNSVTYTPDGNLIVSMRHQDWVIKINYADGAGDGSVLWRLGPEGDFTIDSADPFPWNSHQHDASYISDNRVLLYDNGNTRCEGAPEACYSRGQVYELDESTMEATHVLNANLRGYALAVSSAQLLGNGTYYFASGALSMVPTPESAMEVINPEGEPIYAMHAVDNLYRSYRLPGLYFGNNWAVNFSAQELEIDDPFQ